MTKITTLKDDPDILWIQLRAALREGRIVDAADAQRRLRNVGITVCIEGLELRHPVTAGDRQ